ncbi:MAG: HAD-IA family hydrolase [Candidatus Thermoplasmatota archaeon]|nr:HAD-IA family hydrolase [Candidatus Thermoplasmatota archaeon]
MKSVKVLGLDLDGTLVSMKIDLKGFKEKMNIPNGDTLEYIASLPEERSKKIMALLKEKEIEAARKAELAPGANDLLSYCVDNRIKVVVITRNSQKASQLTLDYLDLKVDMLISRENAAPKPSPDAFNIVLNQLGLKPFQMAYVGDYLYDIQAGNSAGVKTILIADQENAGEWAPSADFVVEDLYEVLNLLKGKVKDIDG